MVINVTPKATVRVPAEENSRNPLTLATWNILGDQYDREERLLHASAELYDIDILAVQEAVQPINDSPNTATELARHGGMQVASYVPAGVVNSVSKDQMASAILTRLEIIESNIIITAPAEETDNAIGEHKQYAAAS